MAARVRVGQRGQHPPGRTLTLGAQLRQGDLWDRIGSKEEALLPEQWFLLQPGDYATKPPSLLLCGRPDMGDVCVSRGRQVWPGTGSGWAVGRMRQETASRVGHGWPGKPLCGLCVASRLATPLWEEPRLSTSTSLALLPQLVTL